MTAKARNENFVFKVFADGKGEEGSKPEYKNSRQNAGKNIDSLL